MSDSVPALDVKHEGSSLGGEFVSNVVVSRAFGAPSALRLELDEGAPQVAIGDAIVVEFAPDGAASTGWVVFDGEVTATGIDLSSGFAPITIVEAHDKAFRLARSADVNVDLDMDPKSVIERLIGTVQLRANGTWPQLGATRQPAAYRWSTALEIIDDLVAAAGYEWSVDGANFIVHALDASVGEAATFTVSDDLLEFQASASAADHVDEVTVSGWDPVKKESIEGSASWSAPKSASIETTQSPSSNVPGGPTFSVPRPVVDQTDATALAAGAARRQASSTIVARCTVVPGARVVPGDVFKIAGLDPWNGKYVCSRTEFRMDSGVPVLEVESGSYGTMPLLLGGTGAGQRTIDGVTRGLTIGVVTDNQDPDGSMNRVKLKLPYLSNDLETSWARVVQPGAGHERGWILMPEIDDEVLVGFEHGSLDHPVVLGGLHNGVDRPKYDASNDLLVQGGSVVSRVFTSKVGHEVFVADGSTTADQYVRIVTAALKADLVLGEEKITVTSDGTPITITDGTGTISLDGSGKIVLDGAEITLKSSGAIKVEATGEIGTKSTGGTKIEATGPLDLKASAPATVESSAITTVKGSMVKIN